MLDYLITIVISVVATLLAFILKAVISENMELKKSNAHELELRDNALENGVVCLLRIKLIEYHAKYCLDKSEITTVAYENWLLMYKAYHALGGNGMVEHMKEEMDQLHFKARR